MVPGIAWVSEKVSRQHNFAAIFPRLSFTAIMRKVGQVPIMHKVRFCSNLTHVRAFFCNKYEQGQFLQKLCTRSVFPQGQAIAFSCQHLTQASLSSP